MTEPQDEAGPVFEDEPIDLSDLRWDDAIVLVFFWALAVVVFLQFFTRYVLNDSFGWTEEIARYLLIGVTFSGAVMAVRKESQIAVEFLYRWVPRPVRRVMQIVVDVVCLCLLRRPNLVLHRTRPEHAAEDGLDQGAEVGDLLGGRRLLRGDDALCADRAGPAPAQWLGTAGRPGDLRGNPARGIGRAR